MPKRRVSDYNAIRMQQYADVLFAADVADCMVHYPKVNGKCDLYEMRDLYRTFIAVGRVPTTDRLVDIHRDGMICASTEHIEYIKSITVEGRGELNTAVTRARAKPAAQAKQTALQLRREHEYD